MIIKINGKGTYDIIAISEPKVGNNYFRMILSSGHIVNVTFETYEVAKKQYDKISEMLIQNEFGLSESEIEGIRCR